MKKLKDLILEKLRINKDTESYYDKFVFKPKESDANAKEISDLTVYLPFEILVNNKRKITIESWNNETYRSSLLSNPLSILLPFCSIYSHRDTQFSFF